MASQSARGVWANLEGRAKRLYPLRYWPRKRRENSPRNRGPEGCIENGPAPTLLLGRRSQRNMLPRRALAACHFELNDCKGIPVTQHWLEQLQPWLESVRTLDSGRKRFVVLGLVRTYTCVKAAPLQFQGAGV